MKGIDFMYITGDFENKIDTMNKSIIKKIGDSTLVYNKNMGEFECYRFDEIIPLGDISEEEAIAEVEEIEA